MFTERDIFQENMIDRTSSKLIILNDKGTFEVWEIKFVEKEMIKTNLLEVCVKYEDASKWIEKQEETKQEKNPATHSGKLTNLFNKYKI
jgi:hypothetical protein